MPVAVVVVEINFLHMDDLKLIGRSEEELRN
jgi:hypothetical protein